MQHFDEAGLPQSLLQRLKTIGFATPTPIQAQAIPCALEGHDVLGSAQTGTGKTGAFGIPLVTHLMSSSRGSALVLLPTRELAMQVMKALKDFLGDEKIKTALLIGGESMPVQFRQLKAQPRLIIGTPGRINDHLTRGTLQLHQTNFLVLDEVDRMLDMGFGVQLDAIARFLTHKRQTLMFSATLPPNIQKIAAKYLTDPVRISVGASHAPAAKIKQEHVHVSDSEKYPRLLEELNRRDGSIIVFVKTKHRADAMARKLSKHKVVCDTLHGDLRQAKRNKVITNFRSKQFRVLVATDVAARGLDIPHIEHVINYDLPQNPEDYIHRVGRTARAGADGEAVNFLSPEDGAKWKAIHKLMNPGEKLPADSAKSSAKGKPRRSRGRKPSMSARPEGQARDGGGKARFSQEKPRSSQGGKPRSSQADKSAAYGEKPSQGGKPFRGEKFSRSEKPANQEKHARNERSAQSGKPDTHSAAKPSHDGKPFRSKKSAQSGKPAQGGKPFRSSKPSQGAKPFKKSRRSGGGFTSRSEGARARAA